jgi:hypothetical protein
MSELKSLEFSPPKARYETIAEHVNDKRQKFIVKVSSDNEAALNEYIKNLQANLEYVSENANVASNLEAENTFIDEETTKSVAKTNFRNNLEVFIEAVPNVEMKETPILSFLLKSPIEKGVNEDENFSHNISIPNPQNSKTIITVAKGKIRAELLENQTVIDMREIASGGTGTFTIPNSPPGKKYTVRIFGLGSTINEYSINGNIRVV